MNNKLRRFVVKRKVLIGIVILVIVAIIVGIIARSEERRVGKEC